MSFSYKKQLLFGGKFEYFYEILHLREMNKTCIIASDKENLNL